MKCKEHTNIICNPCRTIPRTNENVSWGRRSRKQPISIPTPTSPPKSGTYIRIDSISEHTVGNGTPTTGPFGPGDTTPEEINNLEIDEHERRDTEIDEHVMNVAEIDTTKNDGVEDRDTFNATEKKSVHVTDKTPGEEDGDESTLDENGSQHGADSSASAQSQLSRLNEVKGQTDKEESEEDENQSGGDDIKVESDEDLSSGDEIGRQSDEDGSQSDEEVVERTLENLDVCSIPRCDKPAGTSCCISHPTTSVLLCDYHASLSTSALRDNFGISTINDRGMDAVVYNVEGVCLAVQVRCTYSYKEAIVLIYNHI